MTRLVVLLNVLAALAPSVSADPIIVLIGGNHSDPSPGQIAGTSGRGGNSGLWRLKGDLLTEHQLQAEYFNWNGTRAGRIDAPDPGGAGRIEQLIRQRRKQSPEAPVILVGNSWGGHTALQVCQLLAGATVDEQIGSQRSIDNSKQIIGGVPESRKDEESPTPETSDVHPQPSRDSGVDEGGRSTDPEEVIEVDLVVFLDPSSFGRGKEPMPTVLPANVRRAVNYHTRNSFGWRGWIEDERLKSIDLGDSENGFLVEGGPKYDSAFNWPAHVSAEWDERIHAAIRARIQSVLQVSEGAEPCSLIAPSAALRRRR